MPTELVDIEGELVIPYETEFAFHFDFGGVKPTWLPKSQVEWHTEKDRHSGTMVVPRWLAEQRGMV